MAESQPPPADPAVQLRGAGVRVGSRWLWRDLDLDVASGELVVVVGSNGAGKTTLLKVLLGLQPLTAGTVLVAGRAPQRARRQIGYVPQQRGFDRDLPLRGRDLVRLGVDGHRWGPPLPSRRRRAAVSRALTEVGAESYADAPVGLLSGGEQQRLRIGQALIGRPSVLLCDEPLLSLDADRQREVTALIDRLRTDVATAVVFVTHEVEVVRPFADRILHLHDDRR